MMMKKQATFLLLTFVVVLGSLTAGAQTPPNGMPLRLPPGASNRMPGMAPPGQGNAQSAPANPAPQPTVVPLIPKVDTITLDDLKGKMTATPDPIFAYQSRMLQLELRETAEKQLLDVAAARQSAATP